MHKKLRLFRKPLDEILQTTVELLLVSCINQFMAKWLQVHFLAYHLTIFISEWISMALESLDLIVHFLSEMRFPARHKLRAALHLEAGPITLEADCMKF
jgi:hypothetical protein